MESLSPALKVINPDTIALAYAVAALQKVSPSVSETKTVPPSSPVSILPAPSTDTEQCQTPTPSSSSEAKSDQSSESDRVAKSRERNREHARKTRLRKKEQLQVLQTKIRTLEAERQTLKQSLRECSIANILLGLSGVESSDSSGCSVNELDVSETDATAQRVLMLTCGKRKRFGSENSNEPSETTCNGLVVTIDGKETVIGGSNKSQINWKTGVLTYHNGDTKQLSVDQLESLRRERNRRHAKMTRDRKKNYCQMMQQTVDELEAENARMRLLIAQRVTPLSSPVLASQNTPPSAASPLRPDKVKFSLVD